MEPNEVKTAADAKQIVEERGTSYIKVAVTDVDGVLRGKYVSRDKFLSALDKGFGFCDVVFGWDSNDQLYDNGHATGWHTGYPDAPVQVVPSSCRNLPLELDEQGRDGLLFLCEFDEPATSFCPRGVLDRVLRRADEMGYAVNAAFEYEFFVFNETPTSAREKGYRDLRTITPGNFGYSVLRSSTHADFYHALLETCAQMRMPLEGLHTETGPGVLEAAIAVDEAMEAADRAVLFKTFCKVLAQQNELMATFMAKWSDDYPGQSGHIHVSLVDKKTGESVFFDAGGDNKMSQTMRHFVGGQRALMPELLCMIAPTVNAFTRLVPGFWAPTSATWGVENRTCALRVIPGSASSQRSEFRVAAADANPYLALAAALASGLHGIDNNIDPGEPVVGNAYDLAVEEGQRFAPTLSHAASVLRESKAARQFFGDPFVEHFAATREWEEREFRKHVTDWELERYFEII